LKDLSVLKQKTNHIYDAWNYTYLKLEIFNLGALDDSYEDV